MLNLDKLDLPVITLTKDQFQNLLDVEGYDMTVDELFKKRKDYRTFAVWKYFFHAVRERSKYDEQN